STRARERLTRRSRRKRSRSASPGEAIHSGDIAVSEGVARRGDVLHRRFDGELALLLGHVEVRAVLPSRTDRQLDVLVDEALQEPRPEGHAVALVDDELERLVGNRNCLTGFCKRQRDLLQVVLRDVSNFGMRERVEKYNFVDPITKFGWEPPFELAHHLALHL